MTKKMRMINKLKEKMVLEWETVLVNKMLQMKSKMKINFESVDGIHTPKITMGDVAITDSDVTIKGVSVFGLTQTVADLVARVTALETPVDPDPPENPETPETPTE